MEQEASGYSIQQAFTWMVKRAKEDGDESYPKTFIDATELSEDDRELLKGLVLDIQKYNGLAMGWCDVEPDANPNQTTTQVIDTVVKGDKKWKTVYLAVYDQPLGDDVVPGSKKQTKKSCVDVARAAGEAEQRDTFVLIGKSPDGFPRCMAQVLYKPSPKQRAGVYKFVWQ
jgi:hypothetical protein